MRTSLLTLCVLAALPASLASQQRTQLTFGGTAAQQIMNSTVDGSTTRFTGLVLGAEGTLVSAPLAIRLRYIQGRVTAKEGGADPRDVVEGEALFGLRVMPWLTIWAGPSARAHATEETTQRWLLWSGRATARGTLLPGRMQTYVELWGALSGKVSDPGGKAGGRGADAGLEARLGSSSSFWGKLAYRIESTHAEGLRETVEAVSLSIVYGLPQ